MVEVRSSILSTAFEPLALSVVRQVVALFVDDELGGEPERTECAGQAWLWHGGHDGWCRAGTLSRG